MLPEINIYCFRYGLVNLLQIYNKMQDNTFFVRNTIKNIADFSQSALSSKIRSKRAQSVAHLSSEMKTNRFGHRQVFDSKIYEKVNFFKLGLTELRNKMEQSKITSLHHLHQVILELSQYSADKMIANFTKQYANHWKLAEKNNTNQIAESITVIITQLLKKLLQKFEAMQKTKSQMQDKIQRMQTDLKGLKKSATLNQSPENKQISYNAGRQASYRQKNMVLDFEIKKEILRCEKLQQKLREQAKLLIQLEQSNAKLLKEKEQHRNERQAMEYKVNRLKEELQVAHIIKEQNLAQKMKYIMNW